MVYPLGTVVNGTPANGQGDGTYIVEFDPFTNPLVMAESYDIWYNGSKQRPAVFLGDWLWRFKYNIAFDVETIVYANLEDGVGSPILPATLPKATCVSIVSLKDFPISCIDIDEVSATFKIGSFGTGNFPVPVILTISSGIEIKEAV